VGSICIQLAGMLTDLTAIATASRPETIAWVKEMGTYHVIDHRQLMATRVAAPRLVARFTKLGDRQALPFEGVSSFITV
jgi:NADPH:quinone reductase-like Zn-dependent oxidoreductase